MDGFPSGQRGQTVNLLATPSKVRILLHPLWKEQVNRLDKTKAVRILLHPLWEEQVNQLDKTKAVRILLNTLLRSKFKETVLARMLLAVNRKAAMPQWRNWQTHRT